MHRGALSWLFIFVGTTILGSGCGGNFSSPFKEDPKKPTLNSGAQWDTPAPQTPSQDSGDQTTPPPDGDTPTQPQTPPAPHNTNFCQVDANGTILSPDQIHHEGGGNAHGWGGGCIRRPIRETWAALLNPSVIKSRDVDDMWTKVLPGPPEGVAILLQVTNHVKRFIFTADWTEYWYYSVTHGSSEEPDQIVVRFQKVQGTTHISQLSGSIVLDRVTPTVTGFVMDHHVQADQYDDRDSARDIAILLEELRKADPVWSLLPGSMDEVGSHY